MILLGATPLRVGESCKIQRENKASLSKRRSGPPLSPESLAEYLDRMQARGVCLSWEEGVFTLSWPASDVWPFRDELAWKDTEVVRVNFDLVAIHFGLRPAHGIDPSRPLVFLPMVVVDIETTQPPVRICEIAVCRIEPGEDPEWFSSLVDPEQPIRNSQYHGITDADVRGQPRFREIAERVHELVADAVFVSHSTSYLDERETKAELKRCGLDWEPAAKLNTCKLSQRLLPQMPDHKLQTLAKVLRLKVEQAHRARSDVETTIALLDHLRRTATKLSKPPVSLAEFLRL